jgi:hypothetical protein
MLAEERFEGGLDNFGASLPKLVQDVARFVLHPSFPLLLTLTVPSRKRLHAIGSNWLLTFFLSFREQFIELWCLPKYSGSDWDMRSASSPAPRASLTR